mgnify:CR=1 FL=1
MAQLITPKDYSPVIMCRLFKTHIEANRAARPAFRFITEAGYPRIIRVRLIYSLHKVNLLRTAEILVIFLNKSGIEFLDIDFKKKAGFHRSMNLLRTAEILVIFLNKSDLVHLPLLIFLSVSDTRVIEKNGDIIIRCQPLNNRCAAFRYLLTILIDGCIAESSFLFVLLQS